MTKPGIISLTGITRYCATLPHAMCTLAETIVGDVILHFWEVRADVEITTSLRSYLAASVRHRCLDWMKSQQTRKEIPVSQSIAGSFPSLDYISSDDYPLGRLLEGELEDEIMKAIDQLPPMCRRVFRMSRVEGLSNEAVAKQLGLSVNTVKYHIKHALSLLRQHLSRYLIVMILMEMTKW